jgi:hypothetical protein
VTTVDYVNQVSVGNGSGNNSGALSIYGSVTTVATAAMTVTGPVKVVAIGEVTFDGTYDGSPDCVVVLYLNSPTGTLIGSGGQTTVSGAASVTTHGIGTDSASGSRTVTVYLRAVSSDNTKACHIAAGWGNLTIFSMPY